MCAQAVDLTLSDEERAFLLYLGQNGVDYLRMGHPERFPGAYAALRDKGWVSGLGGSNLTVRLTANGLRELYRVLDRQGTLQDSELENRSQDLSPDERLVLVRVLHGPSLVESVASIETHGIGTVERLVDRGLLRYTGYPGGSSTEVYLTEAGYQMAKWLARHMAE